jgi:hypothetical protein
VPLGIEGNALVVEEEGGSAITYAGGYCFQRTTTLALK